MPNKRIIELDSDTADVLEARAVEQGLPVSELIEGMTALQTAPVALPAGELAELDRRWAAVKAGEPTVPHDEVARWLKTWGTPAFKPSRDR